MALDTFVNFGDAEVDATGYNSSATTVNLATGEGAKWAALTPPYNVTWWNYSTYPNPSDDPNVEIVTVTNRSTDTLAVTRGQESISASTKNTGGATYRMLPTLTAKTLNTDLPATYAALAGAAFTGAVSVASTGTPGVGLIGDTAAASLYHDTYATSTQSIFRYRRARGSLASPLRAQLGDTLGNIQFWGAAAATNVAAASFSTASAVIRALATEDIASGSTGGKLELLTTAIGASSTTVRATIDENGIYVPDTYIAAYNSTFTSNSYDGLIFTQYSGGDAVISNGMDAKAVSEKGGQIDFFYDGRTIRISPGSRPESYWQLVLENNGNPSFGSENSQIVNLIAMAPDTVTDYYNGVWRVAANDGTNYYTPYEWGVEGKWTNAGGSTLRRWYLWDFKQNAGVGGNLLYHDDFNVSKLHVGDSSTQIDLLVENGSIQVGNLTARSGTAGTHRIDIFNGTPPTGTLANGGSFYSVSGEIRAKDSNGVEARPMRPNGRGHARCQGYAFP